MALDVYLLMPLLLFLMFFCSLTVEEGEDETAEGEERMKTCMD